MSGRRAEREKENMQTMEMIRKKIEEAELILVGIGENFGPKNSEEVSEKACRELLGCLKGKNYFVITVADAKPLCGAGFRAERIARPLETEQDSEGTDSSRWDAYTKWLQGTLNKKLLVMELGVGLQYPSVIRFPFEKIVFYNLKAELLRVHDRLFQLPAELNGRGISVSVSPVQLFTAGEG